MIQPMIHLSGSTNDVFGTSLLCEDPGKTHDLAITITVCTNRDVSCWLHKFV